MRRGRGGLSELLSALILLSISIAVAFIMVYYLPIISPPSVKPWLRPTLITAFKESDDVKIYLYNPHSDNIKVVEAWVGGMRLDVSCPNDPSCIIEPRSYEYVHISGIPSKVASILLRFDTGAWMEVRLG